MYRDFSRQDLPKLTSDFLSAFLPMAGQSSTPWLEKSLFQTSASITIEVIANLLRMRFASGQTNGNAPSVAFIEPCFDSLPSILKRHDLNLEPIDESWLIDDHEFANLYTLRSAAIFLVLPNNPTGTMISEDKFYKLAQFCKDTRKILIVDNCFCLYPPEASRIDQQRILSETGTSCLLIYETGKTWPTYDIKLSFVCPSEDLYRETYNIHSDFTLHPSPFALPLLTASVRLSAAEKMESVKAPLRHNLAMLKARLMPFGFRFHNPDYTSLAWIDTSAVMSGQQLTDLADQAQIYFLPGEKFFWNTNEKGRNFVRIALARDENIFEEACSILSHKIQERSKVWL